MALLSSLRHAFVAKVPIQRRGITMRRVALVLALAVASWTLYRNYLRRSGSLFPQQNVIFWPPETSEIWAERAAQVKSAFLHAYHGYEKYAFPHDELRPLSNLSLDNFNGWGVTAVDSLDTMLLMNLQDEFNRTIPMIRGTNFSLPTNTRVPFFETVIRYLGGLLSAYALSNENLFRDKADELATRLSPAFNTSTGFPKFEVDTYNARSLSESPAGILAEIASFQMEYAYLGHITGKKEHINRATSITNLLYNTNLTLSGGMYPTRWHLFEGKPLDSRLSIGGASDSGHEYTLKQFLLTSHSDRANLEMYLRLTSHVINNLLYVTPLRQLLYVTDSTDGSPSYSFEHLSCFFPGLLALGAHLLPLNNLETVGINVTELADDLLPRQRQGYFDLMEFDLADLHLWAAQGIAQTCYLSYADQPSGLGPDTISMRVDRSGEVRWIDAMRKWKKNGQLGSPPGVGDKHAWVGNPKARTMREKQMDAMKRDYGIKNTAYYLRPEAVESFYILWRTTGDVKWRHRGWSVFQAIERNAKTPSGYANVDRVHSVGHIQQDSMPSYFLAETLKYLYLLFMDEEVIPLKDWVFNTEAHPLPVFEWT